MRFADRVKETTTTTGTGDITLLGAVAQFVSFTSIYEVGRPFKYAIVGQTGTEWEVGKGHLSGATTLVRDVVDASSNAGALVSFSAGTKDVWNDVAGKFATRLASHGEIIALNAGQAMP